MSVSFRYSASLRSAEGGIDTFIIQTNGTPKDALLRACGTCIFNQNRGGYDGIKCNGPNTRYSPTIQKDFDSTTTSRQMERQANCAKIE